MKRILFVSNGHGEAAIADRIALELQRIRAQTICDHVALVGEGRSSAMREVGPQRRLPSGGIVAMGNLRNILRDLRGGLIGLTLEQHGFLSRARTQYDCCVAIGDVFALLMTLAAHLPTVYVGTAKSVSVAAYGPIEERVLRRARAVFVRDAATARRLRAHGVDARAPGNVIVDLYSDAGADAARDALEGFEPAIALFPGSRASAYEDACFLLRIAEACASSHPTLGAVLSVASTLEPQRFVERIRGDGWQVDVRDGDVVPFVVTRAGRTLARAFCGPVGALFGGVAMVVGQAGTANEAAAAAGIPVVAFELENDRKTAWYRMRQHGLLGDALLILPGDIGAAAARIGELLDDPERRGHMGAVGRERMGPPGGARAIATAIGEMLDAG
ncbi:MAG: hypothetical protein ACYDGM_05750 [Vulcanimicrobiaceae bacterium]